MFKQRIAGWLISYLFNCMSESEVKETCPEFVINNFQRKVIISG